MPDAARDVLTHVIKGAQRMEQLIGGLLVLSQLDRQPLTKRPVDVTGLVQEVLNELRQQQPDRIVDVRVGALPFGDADRALFKQALTHLLSNAFKFTGLSTSPVIVIGGETRSDETEYFVQDNGVGFDSQFADRLFGVFQRLHGSEHFEGTGVGLSIVQRIIHRHGGRVWAEAAVDQGATFHCTLPVRH
jgi:light-regulated signal transduction histidine kinase (bacteriophytochrome)